MFSWAAAPPLESAYRVTGALPMRQESVMDRWEFMNDHSMFLDGVRKDK
jgi:hypothetical protein